MEGSEHTDLGRIYANRPPHELVNAVCGQIESGYVDPDELRRAEWMWSKRPKARIYHFIERHRFLSFAVFSAATLCLIPFVPLFAWVAILATYPVFMLRTSSRIECWEECYRRSLLRILRR